MRTAASAWRSEWAGAARPRMWWRWWRISPGSNRHQHSSAETTGRSSLLRPYGIGVRPAPLQARLTSSRDPRGRTDSRNRSMDGSGMSSSTPSCSLQPLMLRSWLIAGAGIQHHEAAFGPPGRAPWRQLNTELQYDHTYQPS